MKTRIKDYFVLNTTPDISFPILWDAGKAVLRGVLISCNNQERKLRNEKHKQLLDELTQKEKILKKRPGKKKVEKQIRLLQEQIRTFENQEVLWALKKYNKNHLTDRIKWGNT